MPMMSQGIEKGFNPLAREGRDHRRIALRWRLLLVSIHSPVKGETRNLPQRLGVEVVSIHSPVKGETWAISRFGNVEAWFQSTRP